MTSFFFFSFVSEVSVFSLFDCSCLIKAYDCDGIQYLFVIWSLVSLLHMTLILHHIFAVNFRDVFRILLTLSWRRPLSYRNQPIDLLVGWAGFYMIGKSWAGWLGWFLYDREELNIFGGTFSDNSFGIFAKKKKHHRCMTGSYVRI